MSANKPQPQEITPTPVHDEEEKKVVQKGDQNPGQPAQPQSGADRQETAK